MNSKILFAVALGAIVSACAPKGPEVEELSLDKSEVERGGKVSGSYKVSDRDLEGGKAITKIRVGESADTIGEMALEEGRSNKITFSFTVGSKMPKGKATIEAQAFDEDGNPSNVETVTLTIK